MLFSLSIYFKRRDDRNVAQCCVPKRGRIDFLLLRRGRIIAQFSITDRISPEYKLAKIPDK